MTQAYDPVTSALTGHLSFNVLLAAVLTWPVSLALLRLYTRAVRRSMRQQARPSASAVPTPSADAGRTEASRGQGASAATLYDVSGLAAAPDAVTLSARLAASPRRAALVYAGGGVAYALVMAASQLLADDLEIRPLRFLFLFWMFAWPVVLSAAIVAATTRVQRALLVAAYFAGLSILGVIGLQTSPDLTWGQVFMLWILYDMPPTILLLTYLSRSVRAVGPLVLTFIVLALTGSDLAVSTTGSQDSYLRAIIALTGSVGIGGHGTFVVMLAVGFLTFAIVGWIALAWIRRRYQAKQISDESVTVDAIWILFATVHSMNLVFGHPLWALASLAALGVYATCVRVGFSWLRGRETALTRPPALLVLRSFSIGKDGERLFDVIDRVWRRVGSIQMIAGVDLASRTVEPHEFLDFIAGKLARRFIDGPAAMDQRLRERDTKPDRDLRFRVNDFFCYDDTWKMVLSRLVHESDAVLMDLRGFSRQNAGCVFELHELVRLVPLDRVVFVIDHRTDEMLLAETLGDRRAGVYRLASLTGHDIRALVRALAMAATSTSAALAPA